MCRYLSLIKDVEQAAVVTSKTSKQYRHSKRFSVLTISGIKKLIAPDKGQCNESLQYFIHDKEVFDIIHQAH